MAKMVQTGEFFVVGGSVQADRPSYIERAADGELFEALRQGEFCYVLEPRASGKSSLMGRAVRRVREDGQLAAIVDLTQISATQVSLTQVSASKHTTSEPCDSRIHSAQARPLKESAV